MFRGINAINLDAKGRMSIPARYRSMLKQLDPQSLNPDSQVIVTVDTEDPCLLLYPILEWEILESKLEGLPSFNKEARRVQRLLIGHATELEIDTSGRILLPAILREYASIERQVIMVGQGRKFELWSDEVWEKERSGWIASNADKNKAFPAELLNLSI